MKIVGYCRVSTDNQKEEGTVELQVRALADYAKANDHDLVEVFKDEGVSGGLEHRPALARMFSYLEANLDVEGVLIYKLDRLARDLYIQEGLIKKFEERKVRLISTKERDLDSSDPMRKAFRQFMGIVSELEKSFITMRLSGGRINKAINGGYAGGGVALGYKAEAKDLVIDPAGVATIEQIYRLHAEGKSMNHIARLLDARGVATARGGKWYPGTVKYILKNKVYSGHLIYKNNGTQRDDLRVFPRKKGVAV